MGIKGLWTVLTPYCERKSLHEVRGETLAVDLSGWVCDSQNVTEYHIQPKLYLRNLFFRTAYLILADIYPIFVLEGDAPELKRDVMAARNQVQFRGAAPKEVMVNQKKPDVARKKFKGVLKECEALLSCLGVRCIKGHGEAEATCAALNAQNLVDAVVSQDSDCFAYGARRVYRNFSVSNSAGGGVFQGSVDCYDADKMYTNNGFGRKKMVGLALLCGCDYGTGACGSSINTAVAFLHTISENEVIPRLLSWVTDVTHYEELARWCSSPGRCSRCGHVGRTHNKNGCPICVTHRGCNDTGHKAKLAEVKRELSLRNRALNCGSVFPEPKIMKEFLNTPLEEYDLNKSKNPTPNLIKFVKLMTNKLDWTEKYCVEKFLPLLTKWHLQDNVDIRTIKATAIKKKRLPRGVPSYEVIWTDIDGHYTELIPDDQFEEDEDHSTVWTTIERQDLMQKYYPEIVETYEESIKKPPKEKKTRTRAKKGNFDPNIPNGKNSRKLKNSVLINNLNKSTKTQNSKRSEQNVSGLNVSVSVNKLKRKIKSNVKKGQKTLNSFIVNKSRKVCNKNMQSIRNSFRNLSLTHCNDYFDDLFDGKSIENDKNTNYDLLQENKHYLSLLNNSDDQIDDGELSDIIGKIVSRSPAIKTARLDNNLVKLVFQKYSTPRNNIKRRSLLTEVHKNCSTPIDSPIVKNKSIFTNSRVQTTYFSSTPRGSPLRKSTFKSKICLSNSKNKNVLNDNKLSLSTSDNVNTSFFFDKLTEDCDAFEMSLENKTAAVLLDSTVNYSLDSLPHICMK